MKKSHRYKNILETKKMVKNILKVLYNLNNYLWLHGCLSFRTTYVRTWVRHTLGISASSQNVTNESFLLCVKSEKYALKKILESPPGILGPQAPPEGLDSARAAGTF